MMKKKKEGISYILNLMIQIQQLLADCENNKFKECKEWQYYSDHFKWHLLL